MPAIAIIGRQNIGKSTLFNALIGKRRSIVFDRPGVTRDLITERVDWGDGTWTITDFPGLESLDKIGDDELTKDSIRKATEKLADYHLLIWVVTREGLTDFEHSLADTLRRSFRNVWVAVNFMDDPSHEAEGMEFYSLGFSDLYFVSGLNKRGIAALRTAIVKHFNGRESESTVPPLPEGTMRLAIIGKPNAGKSTLFNRLLQKEKSLTSNVPGTTRDTIEDLFTFQGKPVYLVDTAGLKRRSRMAEDVDFYSMRRTEKAIADADVILLLIDPHEKIDRQNKNLVAKIAEAGKPMVFAVNKYDLLKEEHEQDRKILDEDIQELRNTTWEFPYYYVSAIDGRKTTNLIQKAFSLFERSFEKTGTGELNRVLDRLRKNPVLGSNHIKVFYITQAWPGMKFILFSNRDKLPTNIERYLVNSLQRELGLQEFPVRIENRIRGERNKK